RRDRAPPLEGGRGTGGVGPPDRAARAAEQHRAQLHPAAHAARRVDYLAQRGPELVLVQAGPLDAAGQAEQPGAGGALRADLREGRAADPQDLQYAEQRLHVVDAGWLPEQAGLGGERRLVARLGPPPPDPVVQRGP